MKTNHLLAVALSLFTASACITPEDDLVTSEAVALATLPDQVWLAAESRCVSLSTLPRFDRALVSNTTSVLDTFDRRKLQLGTPSKVPRCGTASTNCVSGWSDDGSHFAICRIYDPYLKMTIECEIQGSPEGGITGGCHAEVDE